MQLHPSESLINSRYELHQILGQGGMGAVYLCTDRITNTKLALKRVLTTKPEPNSTLPASPNASPMLTAQFEEEHSEGAIRLALSQEFETLASLRHPNIISVLDYGFDQSKQPFFTMPLLQDAQNITEAAEGQSIERKVQLIGEMLQALAYLHHRGIVHRDLKPDNVLVTPEMRVKVLDFGLAVLRERQDVDEQVAGTIPYMAPEILRGEAANLSTDIFAAGLIAFEILAGHYPFPHKNVSQIIMAILTETPDLDELDISKPLYDVLEDMLERTAEERIGDAHAAFVELKKAPESSLLTESEEARESFLAAARFVGREEEVRVLNERLLDATKGHGSSWLIGGESGVGKSRLIDELRVRALVSGVTVLRGQAVSDGGSAFQVWRDPLRRLLLMSDVDDYDCSILKTLIPDIEHLLQRPIPDAESRGNTSYLDQLKSVIVKLFRSQNQPMLLILEDLQWTDEGLEILEIINSIVERLRIMIVGTYRDDERAALAQNLRSMNLIKLERFGENHIAELSASLLGTQQPKGLVELLKRETEGNVQFMIEVIRALAKDAGDLHNITNMDLPREVAAGGIQRILNRRLENLTDDDILLLRLCALIGREVNEVMLKHLIAEQAPDLNSDDWLARCLNRGIFDLRDAVWRFSHDRLRTSIVQDLDEAEKGELHRIIAVAIEEVYPDSPEQYAKLQYHWGEGGVRHAELKYAVAAGDYALKLNMFLDARRFYEIAFELLNVVDNKTTAAFSADILLKLGQAQFHTSDFEDSRQNLENALALLNPDLRPLEVAEANYFLANTLWRLSDFEGAQKAGQACLEIATEHNDEALMANAYIRMASIAREQGDYDTSWQLYEQARTHALNADAEEALAATYNNMGVLAHNRGDYDAVLEYFEKSLEISRKRGALHRVVSSLQNLGAAAGMRDDHDKAGQYFQQGLELARNIGDRHAVTALLANLGFMNRVIKNFDVARDYLQESLDIARAIGQRGAIAMSYKNIGELEQDSGDLEQARRYFIYSLREAYEIGTIPFVLNVLSELAQIHEDSDTAIRWYGLVQSHQATQSNTHQQVKSAIEELRKTVGDEIVDEQLANGAELDLDELVESILAEADAVEVDGD